MRREPPWRVIALGASAGGLEALSAIMRGLPPGFGAAVIVVQHMSATHPSLLSQLLGRETRLPVVEISDTLLVQPGWVYVAPPRSHVTVVGGRFKLESPSPARSPTPSVDQLLRSLASSYGARAIGVILSGTGSDGAKGARALHASGGTLLVQSPATARYDGMPQAAIEAVPTAPVVALDQIAATLIGHVARPTPSADAAPGTADPRERLCRLVQQRTGVDVSAFKRSTFERRLARRLAAVNVDTLEEYLDHVAESPEELERFLQELLISVTSFYRDRTSFEALESALDALVERKKGGETVRLWVAGCATGEEAYSLAFLMLDRVLDREDAPAFKIYATDIDAQALGRARLGVYPNRAFSHLTPAQRARYVTALSATHAEVRRDVRKLVTFATHDLTRDPPFLRVDLISCRNVLIYFQPATQARIFALMHHGLAPSGLLFLGQSEAVPKEPRLFEVVDKNARLFRRLTTTSTVPPFGATLPTRALPPPRAADGLAADHQRLLLAGFAPPSVLLRGSGDVLHTSGDLKGLVSFPTGRPSLRLTRVLPTSLRAEATSLLHRAGKQRATVVGRVHRVDDRTFRMQVEPDPNASSDLYLLAFVPVTEAPAEAPRARAKRPPSAGRAARYVQELEEELRLARDNLDTALQELESAQEESETLAEEMQSANEELQSTNEELETANEELQSTNEELNTVNDELQRATRELGDVNADLLALVDTMTAPVVLFDDQLRVLRSNAPARQLFAIPAEREGDSATPLVLPPVLAPVDGWLRTCLEDGKTLERELADRERKYVVTVAPCRLSALGTKGVMLQLSDLSNLTRAERALEVTRSRLRAALEHSAVAVLIADRRGIIEYANGRAVAWASQVPGALVGRVVWEIFPGEGAQLLRERHFAALSAEAPLETEDRLGTMPARNIVSVRFPLLGDDGTPSSVCWQAIDIMAREDERSRLAAWEAMSRAVFAALPASIAVLDAEGKITEVNERWMEFALQNGGLGPAEWVGVDYIAVVEGAGLDKEAQRLARALRDVLAGRLDTITVEYPCHSPTERRWFRMSARRLGGGAPGMLVFHVDVTSAVEARLRVSEANASLERRIDDRTRNLRTVVEELEMFTHSVSHDLRSPLRTLSVYSELLEAESAHQLSAAGRDHVHRIGTAATRMRHYLDELLKLSHLGRGEITRRETNLSEIAREIIADLRKQEPERQVEVTIEDGAVELGDPYLLRAVLENLLGNAWKYTVDRRPARIELARHDAPGTYFVRDNGIGFDMAFKDKLFMPFQRLHDDARIRGDGLGLATAARIVSRHGGRLWADGRPGLGATFYFSLREQAS